MKRTVRTLAVALVGAGLFTLGATPALAAEEFCAMGGTLVKTEVDADKAIAWGKERRKAAIADEGKDTWSVLTLSTSADEIAILVNAQGVFFGVAGKGGEEVTERDIDKAFGNSLRKLRESVKREMGDLREAGAAKISGSDVQPLSDAAGLGTLEKSGRDWELKTQDCKGVDLDTSGF